MLEVVGENYQRKVNLLTDKIANLLRPKGVIVQAV